MPVPNAPWIAGLLEMQYGTNGLRDIRINVLPGPCMHLTNPADSFLANAARLDSLLQSMIEKGAENFRYRERDIVQDIVTHT